VVLHLPILHFSAPDNFYTLTAAVVENNGYTALDLPLTQ